MHSFNERFIELLKTIDAIAFEKLDERLINYLKKKSEVFGKSALQLSHNQIAEEMGTVKCCVTFTVIYNCFHFSRRVAEFF